MIQLKRDARQIAGVLEQGEEREKDRHRRQHDRNDGREHAPHAVGEQGDRAGRQAERGERTPERRFEPEQKSGKHGADGVRAGERQPENEREQQEHERNAEAAAEHNTVDGTVAGVRIVRCGDAGHSDLLGAQHRGGGQNIVKLVARLSLVRLSIQTAPDVRGVSDRRS